MRFQAMLPGMPLYVFEIFFERESMVTLCAIGQRNHTMAHELRERLNGLWVAVALLKAMIPKPGPF